MEMIICGVNCTGYRPTASDPLAQIYCKLNSVHYPGKFIPDCYKPQKVKVYDDEEEEGT